MYEFRLIQASDLHFGAESGRAPSLAEHRTFRNLVRLCKQKFSTRRSRGRHVRVTGFKPATHCLERVYAFGHALRTWVASEISPDLIVVTGDVAATGHHADLSEAVKFFNGEAVASPWNSAQARPQLEAWVHVVPGNHDRYSPAIPYLPGNMAFDSVFQQFWRPKTACRRVAYEVVEACSERLIVVSADFSLRTQQCGASVTGHLGTGRIYNDVLADLVATTSRLKQKYETRAVLWAVHFPPKFPQGDKSLRLHDDWKLIAEASKLGVRAILAGHTHRAKIYELSKGLVVICAGSTTQAQISDVRREFYGERSSFYAISVRVQGGNAVKIGITTYEYSDAHKSFVENAVQHHI